jgi:GNAT superfamily N-acetyltransferase
MEENIRIVPIKKKDHQAVYKLMKSLGKWFDENALKNIKIDLKYHEGYVAKQRQDYIGFVTYFVYEGIGNIGWIGVREKYQNKKIGKKLLHTIEIDFKKNNISEIQVYTLSDSVNYEPYINTRKFYFNNGFIEYRRVKTGNHSCPEELYLRKKI